VRHRERRIYHGLGHHLRHTLERDPLLVFASLTRRGGRRRRRTRRRGGHLVGGTADVVARHVTVGAGRHHLGEIDAEVLRELAHRRLRQWLGRAGGDGRWVSRPGLTGARRWGRARRL